MAEQCLDGAHLYHQQAPGSPSQVHQAPRGQWPTFLAAVSIGMGRPDDAQGVTARSAVEHQRPPNGTILRTSTFGLGVDQTVREGRCSSIRGGDDDGVAADSEEFLARDLLLSGQQLPDAS